MVGVYIDMHTMHVILTIVIVTGTLLRNFTATDCDSGNNALIQYNITSGNEHGHFIINNVTGHLITNGRLDREMIPEYILMITATDFGDPSRSSVIEVRSWP